MSFNRLTAGLNRLRRSIITRLLLLAMTVVLLGFLGRLTVLRSILLADVGALSAAHQTSIAEYAARDVEDKIRLRLDLLNGLAAAIPGHALAQPQQLDAWLNEHHAIQPFFSAGLQLVGEHGAVLAATKASKALSTPATSDWFAGVKDTKAAYIGKPFRLSDGSDTALTMAVPVYDDAGIIIAVLAGASAINAPNFLHLLAEKKVGETGDFLLVDPRDRVFITAGNPDRVLKPIPSPGLNSLHDMAMGGFRGTGITTNINGVEELAAIASVPTPGWFLVARTPTAEALRPINHIVDLVIRGSIVVSVVVLGILLLMLPRLFRPLTRAARQLHLMATGEQEIRALPIDHADEVGEVAKGFNFLLGVLREKESALKRSEARMTHLAHHDMLTGLPNRAMFEDRLDQALNRVERQTGSFALLYIDLDGFKPINDKSGHAVGDAMLCHVAQRLQDCVRKSDTVARIGGDEFAILLNDLDEPLTGALLVAEQCRNAANQPLHHAGQSFSVGLSIGIACYPMHGRSAGALLRHADQAMYRMKKMQKEDCLE